MKSEQAQLEKRLKEELDWQKKESLYRDPATIHWEQEKKIYINNKKLINFCSNDYLNLSANKGCKKALSKSIKATKLGSGSSRLISGNSQELINVEKSIAQFFQYESALLFASGYQANLALLSTLFDPDDVIFYDKQIHASMIKGLELSKATRKGFNHNDLDHLEKRMKTISSNLKSKQKIKVLLLESCYSMKGDSPNFNKIKKLVTKNNLITIVDEAHAVAAMGPNGRGLCAQANFKPDILIGTFGKAFGFMGAFILSSKIVRDYLMNFASPLIYTTAPPPFLAKYIQTLLPKIKKMDSARKKLKELSTWTKEQFERSKIVVEGDHHILAIPIGDEKKTIELVDVLQSKGFYTAAVRFPTVPKGKTIIRLSLTISHKKKDIVSIIKTIGDFQNNQYNKKEKE